MAWFWRFMGWHRRVQFSRVLWFRAPTGHPLLEAGFTWLFDAAPNEEPSTMTIDVKEK